MEKYVGVLVVHGMGSQAPDYADTMIHKVEQKLREHNINPEFIHWEPAFWSDVVERNENKYLREVKRQEYNLDYLPLRKFIVKALGDAVAYQKKEGEDNVYDKINVRIEEAMQRMYKALGSSDKPLIVMAHSLGCVVASNYIWDKRKNIVEENFLNFGTMKHLITFGSNLPLFSFAYENPIAINKPEGCLWHNYYDKDDVLGYPLKPISESYFNTVDEDIELNVGGMLSSWNPMSHERYWEDTKFTKKVAKAIKSVLQP